MNEPLKGEHATADEVEDTRGPDTTEITEEQRTKNQTSVA